MAEKQGKNALSPSDLKDLAKLSTLPEWETFCRLLDNRVYRDKNAIVSFPSGSPDLPTKHTFYNGRISAIYTIKRQVETAAVTLEQLEEKKEK